MVRTKSDRRAGPPQDAPTADGRNPRAAAGPPLPTDRVWFAQAIRGVACLLVVWAHLGESFFLRPALVGEVALFPRLAHAGRPPWLGLTRTLQHAGIDMGFLGVALFLLTSGFVIPFSLERRTLGGFATRRFFRIYPVYWLCLGALVVLLSWHSGFVGVAFPYGPRTVATNAVLVHGYFRLPTIDNVNWTLAIEELFYVIAAALALGRLLRRQEALLAVAGAFVILNLVEPRFVDPADHAWITGALTMLAYNGALVVYILIGTALHHLLRRDWSARRAIVTMALLFGAFVLAIHAGPAHTDQRSFLVSYSIAFAVFGAMFVVRDRVPRSRTVNALAEISYPLYLVHGIAGYVLMDEIVRNGGPWWLALPVAIGAALLVATTVHVVAEKPSNNLGRRIAQRLSSRPRSHVAAAVERHPEIVREPAL